MSGTPPSCCTRASWRRIIAGIDKFTDTLGDEDKYLSDDIALRDIGLALGALALARMAADAPREQRMRELAA